MLPRLWLAALVLLLPVPGWSCGPEFGISLLYDREGSLLSGPRSWFFRELPRLLPKSAESWRPDQHDSIDGTDPDNYQLPEWREARRESFEEQGLSISQVHSLYEARSRESACEAYAAGHGLPEAVRHYAAGAVAFRRGAWEAARNHFEAVLSRPEEERGFREVWALYMLGRLEAKQDHREAAARHFEQVRQRVSEGLADPLGLAVASLGEEARLHLIPGSLAKALALYAKQASFGSRSAYLSLLAVAQSMLSNQNLLDEAVLDPLSRSIIVLLAHSGNINNYPTDLDKLPAARTSGLSRSTVERLVGALEGQGVPEVTGASWLAAEAYRKGWFDLAGKLLPLERNYLAFWIEGKLALRKGERDVALASYQRAIKAFPREEGVLSRHGELITGDEDRSTQCIIQAEEGVLRLDRGEYVEAFRLFYFAALDRWQWKFVTPYWSDVVYLAERILTVDELKNFVAGNIPAPSKEILDEVEQYEYTNADVPPGVEIRLILARRLMRAGHFAEALTYFDGERLRDQARRYGQAMDRARSPWGGTISQAEAWYEAAMLLWESGMDLLGFEMRPDFKIYDGSYFGNNPDTDQSYTTSEEKSRVKESGPADEMPRFHYRLLTAEHLSMAADHVPKTSQAFAALLCKATGRMLAREPDRAAVYYRRYLKEGPYVPWAAHFGRGCPEPDFERARQRLWQQRLDTLRRFSAYDTWWAAGLLLVVVTLGGWWTRRHFRKIEIS
ncbi:MAG: hypothetical protein HQL56_01610 [Magnetococcales bacterium]|nr:hypothetical protein [Magnetococcales bacterium]